MKAQITRKNAHITRNKINVPKFFFVNYVRAGTRCSLLKSKTAKMYLLIKSVKILLLLSIYCSKNSK